MSCLACVLPFDDFRLVWWDRGSCANMDGTNIQLFTAPYRLRTCIEEHTLRQLEPAQLTEPKPGRSPKPHLCRVSGGVSLQQASKFLGGRALTQGMQTFREERGLQFGQITPLAPGCPTAGGTRTLGKKEVPGQKDMFAIRENKLKPRFRRLLQDLAWTKLVTYYCI